MTTTSATLIASAILILAVQGFAQLLDMGCLPSYEPIIIGGAAADLTPWMAYLIFDGRFLCGGSLITDRFVLTANHCVPKRYTSDNYIVRLGEYDTLTTDDGPHEDFGVAGAAIHSTVDIAILKLNRSVQYTNHIKPICIILDTGMVGAINAIPNLTITGWGRTDRITGRSATKLQQATIQRVHPFFCRHSLYEFCGINPTQFVCFGDSGSPLGADIKYNYITIHAQFGIASSVETTACNTYGNYVDVMLFTSWIRGTIQLMNTY